MPRARRPNRFIAVVWAPFAVVLACHGSGENEAPAPAPVDPTTACTDMFEALSNESCNGPVPPANELARQRGRYVMVCTSYLSLPGAAVTSNQISACAAAMKGAHTCRMQDLAECDLPTGGALKGGDYCADGLQCMSGDCAGAPGCGTCTPAVPKGQPCAAGGNCAAGTACEPSASGPTCAPVTKVEAGGSCSGSTRKCRAGTRCAAPALRCEPLGGPGVRCGSTTDCALGLVCAGSPPVCRKPGGPQTPCESDDQCARGLACAASTHTCSPVYWVAGGQLCSDVTRCLVGTCPRTPGSSDLGGRCPIVISDGQPCNRTNPAATCDVFSECTNGMCLRRASAVCG